MNKALFLDRDGVINQEKHYLYKIEDFEFIAGVFDTCRAFQSQDYLLIVITNQAGIARGKYTEADFEILNDWMKQRFLAEGITLSAVFHCPHHPDFSAPCECRKPSPGMILTGQALFNLDLTQCYLVGDKESDIAAGVAAGIGKNILVRSGHPIAETESHADAIIDSIKDLRPEQTK